MRGIIVCKERGLDTVNRFIEESKTLGIELYHYQDFLLDTTQRYDFALFRNYQDQFRKVSTKSRKQFNDFSIGNVHRHQLNQLMNIDLGLDKPLTFRAGEEVSYEAIKSVLGETFIAKSGYSTLSKNVFLIHNEVEFDKVISRVDIFQKFITTSRGKDLRILLFGGEVVCAVERHNPNNWRSSLYRQSVLKEVNIPAWLQDNLYNIKGTYGIDICAVDLLYSDVKDEYLFLELNLSPYFIDLEELTGKNITRDCLSYCIEKSK